MPEEFLRILHVIATTQEWGGMERCVVDLAHHQTSTHVVAVAGSRLVLDHLNPAVERILLPMQYNRRNPLLMWALRRAVTAFRPGIIHAHAGKAAGLVNGIRHFSPPGIRRIATIHGTKRPLRFLGNFHQVITVSDRVGQSQGGVPYTVVWNGVRPISRPAKPADLSAFPFLGRGKPVIAAVGRLVEEKGFDVLLQAMRDVDGFLWLIGDGPLRQDLQHLTASSGLTERVWFAGFRQDVALLMSLADLMVISSRREGFPLVLAEILHLERPVVATRVAGVEEIIPPEWSCDPDDPSALGSLIQRALSDLPGFTRTLVPIFQLAARELTLEGAAEKIEGIYRIPPGKI